MAYRVALPKNKENSTPEVDSPDSVSLLKNTGNSGNSGNTALPSPLSPVERGRESQGINDDDIRRVFAADDPGRIRMFWQREFKLRLDHIRDTLRIANSPTPAVDALMAEIGTSKSQGHSQPAEKISKRCCSKCHRELRRMPLSVACDDDLCGWFEGSQ